MKKSKDLEKWRDHVHALELRCQLCSNQCANLTQLLNKIIIKYIWKGKGTRIAGNNFRKKNKVGAVTVQFQDTI